MFPHHSSRHVLHGFTAELVKLGKANTSKIKSNDRMPRATKSNVDALLTDLHGWNSPHREAALQFAKKVGPEGLFEILHGTRRWYSGQTMGHVLQKHRESLKEVMQLEPEGITDLYRGFKVPKDHPLSRASVGDVLTLDVHRNRGLSSWSTEEKPTHKFSGGGRGKVGLIVKLRDTKNTTPLLAPPTHTKDWFNALYERSIGKSFRPLEREYLIKAPQLNVEIVKVKR